MKFYTKFSSFLLLIISFTVTYSQVAPIEIDAKLETEAYHRTIVKGDKIYFLREADSKEVTQKQLILSSLDAYSLKTNWEKTIVLNQYQNVLNFVYSYNQLRIFVVKHDLDNKTSEISVYDCDLSGSKVQNIELQKISIDKWENSQGKAEVAQTFLSALDSKQNENEVTPLEYRFGLEFSPDSNRFAIYHFDNSQDRLMVNAFIYNLRCENTHKITYGIDDAHIAYGLKIDNQGDIYQLKVSRAGALAIIKVNPESEVTSYLQIPASSTTKTNPQLYIHADNQAYLAYCNVKDDLLVGVSVALLDFQNSKVEDSHQFVFNQEFLKRQESNIKNGNHFFELAEIIELNDRLLLVLEQHLMDGLDVFYQPNSTESLKLWHNQQANVTTGNVVVVVYDKSLNPMSMLEIPKTQTGLSYDGLNTLGHHFVVHQNEAYFIYSKSSKGFANDILMVQKLDKGCTKWVEFRSVLLPKSHIPIITTANILAPTKILTQTRKGITGKINYLGIYEF
jgi:hypothetical protein